MKKLVLTIALVLGAGNIIEAASSEATIFNPTGPLARIDSILYPQQPQPTAQPARGPAPFVIPVKGFTGSIN